VRADGGQYVIERDNPKRNIPISVMAWLLEHTAEEVHGKTRGIPVHEDFEFDQLIDFFDVEIINVSGIWHTPRICPIKGDWHTNNGKPDFGAVGFAWDDKNRTLGWKDHAQTCDGAQMNVKQVIDFLVEQKGEEYLYRRLWNPGDRSFRRASLWGEELHVLNVGLRYSIVVSGYLWDRRARMGSPLVVYWLRQKAGCDFSRGSCLGNHPTG